MSQFASEANTRGVWHSRVTSPPHSQRRRLKGKTDHAVKIVGVGALSWARPLASPLLSAALHFGYVELRAHRSACDLLAAKLQFHSCAQFAVGAVAAVEILGGELGGLIATWPSIVVPSMMAIR